MGTGPGRPRAGRPRVELLRRARGTWCVSAVGSPRALWAAAGSPGVSVAGGRACRRGPPRNKGQGCGTLGRAPRRPNGRSQKSSLNVQQTGISPMNLPVGLQS